MAKLKPQVHIEMPDKRFDTGAPSIFNEDDYRKKDLKHHADSIKTITDMLSKWDANKSMVTDQAKKSLREQLKHHKIRHAGLKAEMAAANGLKK